LVNDFDFFFFQFCQVGHKWKFDKSSGLANTKCGQRFFVCDDESGNTQSYFASATVLNGVACNNKIVEAAIQWELNRYGFASKASCWRCPETQRGVALVTERISPAVKISESALSSWLYLSNGAIDTACAENPISKVAAKLITEFMETSFFWNVFLIADKLLAGLLSFCAET